MGHNSGETYEADRSSGVPSDRLLLSCQIVSVEVNLAVRLN